MGERTKQLQDAVFLSKVRKARKQSIGEKLLEGPRLFDVACQRMRVGIRHQFPDDDDDQVEKELRHRLKIKRQIDEQGFFVPAGRIDDE